jgi:orotate phosphoribosyltransferase-like protein
MRRRSGWSWTGSTSARWPGRFWGRAATGASFTDNTLTADATEGIAVSGMLNATVTGNTLNVTLGQYGNRPQAQIAVDPQYGSGTIQSPVTSTDVRNCIG